MDVKKLIVISLYLEETSYLIQKFQFPYNLFSQSPGSRKTKYLTPQNYMNFARSAEIFFNMVNSIIQTGFRAHSASCSE